MRRSRGSLEKRLPRPVEEHDQTIASRPLFQRSAGVVRHLWLDHIPCRRHLSTRLGPVKWPRDDSWQRGMMRLGNTTVLEPETRERKAWLGSNGEHVGHSGPGCVRLGWMPGRTANESVARRSQWWARNLGALNLAKEQASTAVSSAPHARERAAHNTRARLKWTGCLCAKQEISRCPKNSPVQSSVVLTCGASREVVPATLRHRGQGCRGMKVQHAQNRKELICPALRDPETETPMNGQAAITPRATGWNREASWADLRMTTAGISTSSFAGKERHLSGAP